jgi:hypothetical protein
LNSLALYLYLLPKCVCMILYELQREDSEGNEEYNVDPAYANRNRHSELILVPNRNSSTINIWLGERVVSKMMRER